MTNQNIRWDYFLIESWPGLMLTAKLEIVKRGIDFMIPQTWRRAKVDGRDQPHSSPRLPGNYAFVKLGRVYESDAKDAAEVVSHLNDQAAALAQLRGVKAVFKNASGNYSAVRKHEIQELKELEATEHQDASKGKGKTIESRFKKGTKLRVLRHPYLKDEIVEYLWSYHGEAKVATANGIKADIPEYDLIEAPAQARMAG
jgi:hypothetical protein